MEVSTFESLLERLTGTAVKELTDADRASLGEALTDDTRAIDATQFNELMLLANKDRVEKAFFHFFFVVDKGQTCSVGNLPQGVERFQLFALLRFGNFIYAFRMLSKCKSKRELRKLIGGPARDPEKLEAAILSRPQKILRVTAIPRQMTYLVGYLSTREITNTPMTAIAASCLAPREGQCRFNKLMPARRRTRWRSSSPAIAVGSMSRSQRTFSPLG